MIKQSQNKMVHENDTVDKYFFPDYGITIEAKSYEEALEKLEVIKNKK